MKIVRIYSTPTCVYCNALKKFLGEHQVAFEDIDVSRDQKAAQEMVQKSGQLGVPVVDIAGEIVVGFDKNKIAQLLKIND
ncbi:MAG: glutaredoxin-like protein [Parcubacteria group bacterium Gr01-1014_30]|nr:MAG: glutaredoxin-like protein [Parcubacteria group bacterium Gr01-1014_30]